MIFDEVFTGLYRLGRRTAASFLGVDADIAVNAKLLTGGLVPLCTTTASQAIFDAFSSSEKSDALLHGHSYTAHAVGCQVAVDSLRKMEGMDPQVTGTGVGSESAHWEVYQENWGDDGVWSMWSPELVRDLSGIDSVEGIFALGTVLSIALRDGQGGGMFSLFTLHSILQYSVLYTNLPDRIQLECRPRPAAETGCVQRALASAGQCALCDGQFDLDAGVGAADGGLAAW